VKQTGRAILAWLRDVARSLREVTPNIRFGLNVGDAIDTGGNIDTGITCCNGSHEQEERDDFGEHGAAQTSGNPSNDCA
jgi:hypothetical protein